MIECSFCKVPLDEKAAEEAWPYKSGRMRFCSDECRIKKANLIKLKQQDAWRKKHQAAEAQAQTDEQQEPEAALPAADPEPMETVTDEAAVAVDAEPAPAPAEPAPTEPTPATEDLFGGLVQINAEYDSPLASYRVLRDTLQIRLKKAEFSSPEINALIMQLRELSLTSI